MKTVSIVRNIKEKRKTTEWYDVAEIKVVVYLFYLTFLSDFDCL